MIHCSLMMVKKQARTLGRRDPKITFMTQFLLTVYTHMFKYFTCAIHGAGIASLFFFFRNSGKINSWASLRIALLN